MRKSSLFLLIIGLVTVVSLVSIWFYPSIHDFMASNRIWNGIRNFNEEFSVENIESLDDISSKAEKKVLICIPYTDYAPEELSIIKQFVAQGNLLLLLDDFGFGNNILDYLGIQGRFSNDILLDPFFNYKNQYFPLITDFSPDIMENGIESIALNHASTLKYVEQSHILATSSMTSFLDSNGNGVQDKNEESGPLVVAAEYKMGQGTVVLVSDPSIIINTMVDRVDNHKFIRYLTAFDNSSADIVLDHSHIAKAPLDASRADLLNAREILANKYVLLGLVLLVFIFVSVYMLREGELIG